MKQANIGRKHFQRGTRTVDSDRLESPVGKSADKMALNTPYIQNSPSAPNFRKKCREQRMTAVWGRYISTGATHFPLDRWMLSLH